MLASFRFPSFGPMAAAELGYNQRVKRFALLITLCAIASCGDDSTGQGSGASTVGQSCDLGMETNPGSVIIASPALGCEERTCLRYPGTTDQCTAHCETDSDCVGDIDSECMSGFVCATPVLTGSFGCQTFCVCQDADPDTAIPAACL
jgi:hypothetical protein